MSGAKPLAIGPLRLDLGAPGDRRDDRNGLWLAILRPYERRPHWFPKAFDPGEVVPVRNGAVYRRHSDLINVRGTGIPWVLASKLAGQEVLHGLDVVATASGPRAPVVKEYVVQAKDRLTVELVRGKGEPIFSGVEILPSASVSADPLTASSRR